MKFHPLSESELVDWAYHPESFVGVDQDVELLVASLRNADVILACAADDQCPKQRFFVNCACLIVGDAVRRCAVDSSERHVPAEKDILAFARRAEKTGNRYLLELAWRARALVEEPSSFDREYWCAGGLVREMFDD
ncbi:hypothetical protein ACUNV4_08955 [Granulosicoccus sp. 3-233]|uniref:hypothetical protein n=1 Tax=Granulosicoccus sp. 3-233 TaxID=3417969 RepID=UPI003D34E721